MAITVNGKVVSGGSGKKGEDGKSAYQYAVDGGYTGTEEQFQALMGTGPWLPATKINDLYNVNNIRNISSSTVSFFRNTNTAGNSNDYPSIRCPSIGVIRFQYSIGASPILRNIGNPTENSDAANKKYVDDSIQSAIDSSWGKAY